jgi:hypothetical protein
MSKNPSLKLGVSITEPNPDTMKYHEVKAKMICDVAVQHMQGWRGAIVIHDERERDECVTERDGVCATNANGCNGCGCAMNADDGCNECRQGVQRMRNERVQRMLCNECDGVQRMRNGFNECDTTNATMGATDARLGVRHAGDSNTKWRRQGVLGGAHNLLENRRGSMKRTKRVY